MGDVELASAESASLTRAMPAPSSPTDPFRALFEQNFGFVCNNLRRLGVPDRDLSDVAHDLFVAVHRRLGELDPTRPVRAWLFAFAVRFASDYRRLARHHRERIQTSPEGIDARPIADEQLSANEARSLVLAALEAIELDRRSVLVLHDIEGVVIPEIAHSLGIPVNSAYTRLRLAREDFKAAVQRLRARRGTP
jgi:RNA polymerase sigma-70 factor (ECF subfamily)